MRVHPQRPGARQEGGVRQRRVRCGGMEGWQARNPKTAVIVIPSLCGRIDPAGRIHSGARTRVVVPASLSN